MCVYSPKAFSVSSHLHPSSSLYFFMYLYFFIFCFLFFTSYILIIKYFQKFVNSNFFKKLHQNPAFARNLSLFDTFYLILHFNYIFITFLLQTFIKKFVIVLKFFKRQLTKYVNYDIYYLAPQLEHNFKFFIE